ncbi:hypothetical protein VTK73DRAFT_1324 [Phialemonium thermophilum]|uniref:Protein kinase domain-containing protein n=1 Tax=Phialemonium thermophilum TaxID=223376 RepID=A0ABR3VTS5_9PEZI
MEDEAASVYTDDSEDRLASPAVFAPHVVSFRLGTRTIRAVGAASDDRHPNVLRVRVCNSILDRVVQGLFRLASTLVPGVRSAFPEWFLPRNLVLKRKKNGWDEEFETERETYQKLRPVQGYIVPTFYSQVEHDGIPAIVLSDVGGACLAEPAGAVLEPEALQPLLHLSQSILADLGILHDDVKLDHFRIADSRDKVIVVDFERVVTGLSREHMRFLMNSSTKRLMEYYKDNLQCLEADGTIRRPLGEHVRAAE